MLRRPTPWQNEPELSVTMRGAPPTWTTFDIYRLLQHHGTVVYIEILELRRKDQLEADVKFHPAPESADWFFNGIFVNRRRYHITFSKKHYQARMHTSPFDQKTWFPEEIKLPAMELSFGVLKSPAETLKLHTTSDAEINLNVQRKCIDTEFKVTFSVAQSRPESYKMRLNFAQIKEVYMMKGLNNDNIAVIIPIDLPPQVFRKTSNFEGTHAPGANSWSAWSTWFRQTDIEQDPKRTETAITQLRKETPLIDIGRWLCYFMAIDETIAKSSEFEQFRKILQHHNIAILEEMSLTFPDPEESPLWKGLNSPTTILAQTSSMTGLHELVEENKDLEFPVRYQLEVCISQGVLNESNLSAEFVEKLRRMEPIRAIKLLEKLADEKDRYWKTDEIFKKLLPRISVMKKEPPKYCTVIHSAVVTPTTIYFATPVIETSNRVVRQYQQYADRFLRVKFTDEKYKGKIMSHDDDSMSEVFDRIKRTLSNGIKVGGRHFEFLAAGNSQFREGGAWFFASAGDVTAQSIRDWMGNFEHIREVAKYCSRVGQCFSTTRALRIGEVEVQTIPDIERGGHNFTDGVGKISPFLAQMVADQHGLPNAIAAYPSVFQFRLGGSKGVLAVDPTLTRRVVQIRPSQAKFSSINHADLNICRISQFSIANLNVQVILVLSALGVPDEAFLRKMDAELSDLHAAMHHPDKARELLCKNVDFNQMTLHLAQMVEGGFMDARDPFTMSCLQLWHSWSVKYLKEKARVPVRKGAFVLGCVDETATLKGHFIANEGVEQNCEALLPEIFLQIPDLDRRGHFRIVTGICTVARNPSLHPGDVRVVRAVDVPKLHHLRNCVVLPQTGDRDVASMCSGGDLDGDDYLVMWDPDLLPTEWNHPPMNYDPPPKVYSDGPVTVDDMTSFFVTHMKNDNLSRIAVAHKYWADFLSDGVKSASCIELANLHSMAVDFAKTGVPAVFPNRLRVRRWPHWAEVKNKAKKRIYQSRKVIGKLYDSVQRVQFAPAWDMPFDKRILEAYHLDETILTAAREAKFDYDAAVRRTMAKFSIASDFEVFTTFALEHSDDFSDYKFAETLGEVVGALKDHQQQLCYEKAGTTPKERDWGKMGPFIAAMYTVTAQEVQVALTECRQYKMVGGNFVQVKRPTLENMPFMSFPWLFTTDLGRIANHGRIAKRETAVPAKLLPVAAKRLPLLDMANLAPLEEVVLPPMAKTVVSGEIAVAGLEQDLMTATPVQDVPQASSLQEPVVTKTAQPLSSSTTPVASPPSLIQDPQRSALSAAPNVPVSLLLPATSNLMAVTSNAAHNVSSRALAPAPTTVGALPSTADIVGESAGGNSEAMEQAEEVIISTAPSALSALEELMAM